MHEAASAQPQTRQPREPLAARWQSDLRPAKLGAEASASAVAVAANAQTFARRSLPLGVTRE